MHRFFDHVFDEILIEFGCTFDPFWTNLASKVASKSHAGKISKFNLLQVSLIKLTLCPTSKTLVARVFPLTVIVFTQTISESSIPSLLYPNNK